MHVHNRSAYCGAAFDGTTQHHLLTSPIVEGTGAELPGLLGLRSLEATRAILDTGGQRLIFPGPGQLDIQLPPGSIEVPLHKAPSGHLVMVIDDYEHAVKKAGGMEEAGLQLHATAATSSSSSEPPPQSGITPPPGLPSPQEEAHPEPRDGASEAAPTSVAHPM